MLGEQLLEVSALDDAERVCRGSVKVARPPALELLRCSDLSCAMFGAAFAMSQKGLVAEAQEVFRDSLAFGRGVTEIYGEWQSLVQDKSAVARSVRVRMLECCSSFGPDYVECAH